MQYNFEWDPLKAESNIRKHRVGFERAAEVFLDPFMLSVFDDAHSETEDRWITVGKDTNDVALLVVHSFKEVDSENCTIKIISARRATKKEEKQYNTR